MGKVYIHSNCAGTFVLGQNFSLKERTLFRDRKDILKNSESLEKGLFIFIERKMIDKYSRSQEVIYLGFKNEDYKGVKTSQDQFIMEKLLNNLKKEGVMSIFHKNNLLITKNRIKLSFERDLLIVQTVNNIKEVGKLTNTLNKRLREWYSFYLPEFSKQMPSNEKFAELIIKKDKKQLLKDLQLSSDQSMGVEISKDDVNHILMLAKEINNLYSLKESHSIYLEKLMKEICPNVLIIACSLIGAKLIAQAGSLKRLSEFPASTVQILGAEKALFRHMKTGARSPKYGILHEHPFVLEAEKDKKGRTARMLADKISIAAKVDFFKGEFIGNELKKDLIRKLNTNQPVRPKKPRYQKR